MVTQRAPGPMSSNTTGTDMVIFLIVAWLLLAAALWGWLLLLPEPEPAGPPPDPHAAELADFRRAVAEWDRSGGADG